MSGRRWLGVAWVAPAACFSVAAVDRAADAAGPPTTTTLAPLDDAGGAAADAATRILTGSRAAYAACATYEDDGVFDIWSAGWGFHETGTFRTVFAGPQALRFAYRQWTPPGSRAFWLQVVADDAGVRFTIGPDQRAQEAKSLNQGIAALTGVSHGLAAFVTALLPTGVRARPVLDVSDARVVTYGDLDGTTCDLIDAMWAGYREQLWIARSDSLIRRVVLEVGSVTTADYRPRCNQPIAPDALRGSDGGL